MKPYRIRQFPDPVLRTPATAVEAFDASLRRLVERMFEAMYEADGVGLAANQVGVLSRVFVFDCPAAEDAPAQRGAVVNPWLVLAEMPGAEDLLTGPEGCLSIPERQGLVTRHARARVQGLDIEGHPLTLEGAGVVARCFQHECDHLDGKLYLDRVQDPGALRD